MDPNTPPSFMSLLDGEDSLGIRDNNLPPNYQPHPYYLPPSTESFGPQNIPYPPPPYHH